MTVVGQATVRVGIEVIRQESQWRPFIYRMFWCQQQDVAPNHYVWSWAQNVIDCLSYFGGVPGEEKLCVGEKARYWATLSLVGTTDYWGEYDDKVEFLKCRRIR